MPDYTVKQGDCISSIAREHGFFWQTLWDHPNNAQLKAKRKNPNVLLTGDVVFVPDKSGKQEAGATECRHRFVKKGEPAKLRLQLLENDSPRANEPYVLDIDGQLFSGNTDAQGSIEHPIPPNANKGNLTVGVAPNQQKFVLQLGDVDPVDEVSGIQARLSNLGFYYDAVDGVMSPATQTALSRFQRKHGLPATGQADSATRAKLVQVHGS